MTKRIFLNNKSNFMRTNDLNETFFNFIVQKSVKNSNNEIFR